MDPSDKWRLRSNRVALLDLDAEEFSPYLVQEGIITPDDSERLGSKCKETSKDKIEALLNMLESKGENAYKVFKNTISTLGGREDLIKKLDKTDMDKMPRKLRDELKKLAAGDSPDQGNIIFKTTTISDRKRQVSVEDEGFATHDFSKIKQRKQANGSVITVKGNGNVVVSHSKVTCNYISKGSSK